MVFWPKLSLRVQKERSQKHFLFGPKVSDLGRIQLIWRFRRMRLFSFCACSYDAHFHSTPSPITPIFIPRLLLRRLFSFPALSYCAYFYFAHSPNTLIFYYVNTVDGLQYTLRVSVPSSELGPPPRTPQAKVAPPWTLGPKCGGGHICFRGREWGDPIPMKGQNL